MLSPFDIEIGSEMKTEKAIGTGTEIGTETCLEGSVIGLGRLMIYGVVYSL
jgi:hypothetical protein